MLQTKSHFPKSYNNVIEEKEPTARFQNIAAKKKESSKVKLDSTGAVKKKHSLDGPEGSSSFKF